LLARSRRAGVMAYGSLVVHYNRDFQEKWVSSASTDQGELLGAADIQSLADMGTGFSRVIEMRPIPFGRRAVLTIALATILPGLPLLVLVMPMNELIRAMAKAAL